ncbi:MAG: restriction endonuclease subunit S [Leptospiraceae bacterium]|nr:restriction endonuclease subunit S [Leptospiraceae bacterium]MCP5494177.1 restriction endonuclease subunit S [Leptospiraceae bacterium]
MLILRIIIPTLDSYFLMRFITSPFFNIQLKDKQTGTAQPQIPANILQKLKIPIPPLEEQKEIVSRLTHHLGIIDELEENHKALKARIKRLRQAILSKAFKGHLVPQDENDEPASVLLERSEKRDHACESRRNSYEMD